jgi:hypothetical protein
LATVPSFGRAQFWINECETCADQWNYGAQDNREQTHHVRRLRTSTCSHACTTLTPLLLPPLLQVQQPPQPLPKPASATVTAAAVAALHPCAHILKLLFESFPGVKDRLLKHTPLLADQNDWSLIVYIVTAPEGSVGMLSTEGPLYNAVAIGCTGCVPDGGGHSARFACQECSFGETQLEPSSTAVKSCWWHVFLSAQKIS